jgi:2-methylcitrate dehydratase PrpD
MHPTIEGVITLLDESGATAADVEHIEATVNDYVSWVTGKREPATGLEAKFSIYHAAAVAALDGAAGPKQFTDERARADDVVALRDRIGVAVDETLPKVAARVTIELVDGTMLEKTVPANKGTPQRPMSDSDIEAKFVALAEDVIGGSRAKEVVGRCWDLEQEADFAEIAQLCASSPA